MTQTRTTDVLIVGGGPAGLAAAIALRHSGLRVLVADHAAAPIDKACGEGLMPDSLEVLQRLGVSLHEYRTGEFRGIRFVGLEGSAAAEFPQGRGVGIRRVLLHQALIDHAQRAGVQMLWRARVRLHDQNRVTVDGSNVRYQWLVGADGQNSAIKYWAGLEAGRIRSERIGLRRHFRTRLWSDFVEIHWADQGQAYVTPVNENEVCVALISRNRFLSFESGLEQFSILAEHLRHAEPCTQVRGALTLSRRLRSVSQGNVALIGDAAGSVDAVTGEGLAMGFRQALALAEAVAAEDLTLYQKAHKDISSLPEFMARSMLLMDQHAWLRRRALRSFSRKPQIFERLLRVHVGDVPLTSVGTRTLMDMGWQMLTARAQSLPASHIGEQNAF